MGGKAEMVKKIFVVIIFGVLCFSVKDAYAGKVELSTYYPAPVGEYKNLNTTENTNLATKTGSVTVGSTTQPLLDADSDNTLTLLPVDGNAVAQTGGVEGSIRYSRDANGVGKGGLLYKNSAGWGSLGGGGAPSSWDCTLVSAPGVGVNNVATAMCPAEDYRIIVGYCSYDSGANDGLYKPGAIWGWRCMAGMGHITHACAECCK